MDNRAVWAARASQDDPRVFRRQDRRAPRRPPDPASNSAAVRGKASKRLLVCSTGTGGANARQRPATGLEATAVVSQEEFEVPALTQGVAGPLSSRQFLSPPASTPRLLRLGTPPAPSPSAAAKGPSEGAKDARGRNQSNAARGLRCRKSPLAGMAMMRLKDTTASTGSPAWRWPGAGQNCGLRLEMAGERRGRHALVL